MKNIKFGIISQRDARWLGMSASVAGGWVMTPDEWMNVSRLPDELGVGLGGLLAAIPDAITTAPVRPVDPVRVAQILRDDIQRNERRQFCRSTIEEHVGAMRHWLSKVSALLAGEGTRP